jgi:hypothetical protein
VATYHPDVAAPPPVPASALPRPITTIATEHSTAKRTTAHLDRSPDAAVRISFAKDPIEPWLHGALAHPWMVHAH